MNSANPDVDPYFIDGCMRCPLGGTPECKVHNWEKELEYLRNVLLECGLTEELKWGVPCYTFNTNNVIILAAFKEYCSVSFFKGVLLSDPHQLLVKPGENSQSAMLFKFTSLAEILKMDSIVREYIFEAIEVENAGLKVPFKKNPEPLPEELETKFEELPMLEAAFYALTPGRQRGYVIYFSAPKQSKTRISRIEKCMSKIYKGEGFYDDYKK